MLQDSLLNIGLPAVIGHAREGTFNGSKVRVKQIRVYSEEDPQKAKKVCSVSAIVFPCSPVSTNSKDLPPSGRALETFNAPKYRSSSGCYHLPLPAYIRMDARWESDGIHRETPRRKQIWSRRCPLVLMYEILILALVVRCR